MQLYRFMAAEPRANPRAGRAAALLVALVAAQVAAMPVTPAAAQGRPSTPAMSCAQAAALVQREGAVVLSTGPTTFDRYVREVRFCSGAEQLKPEWVATRDVAKCFIGYTCIVPDRDNWIR